jgi:ubiquinone/menaquinone biosynthesis C-methylase UbiE
VDPRTKATLAAYDKAAAEYQEFWRQRRPLDAVRKFAALAGKGATILDPACGPVLDVRLLRDAGLRVVAGDLSHEVMKLGKMLHPKGALARWDFRNLPFLDATFGGVWAPATLQHLSRAEMLTALRELRRVQREGPIFLTFRQGGGDLDEVEDPPAGAVYASSVTADELKALLLGVGYVEVEVEQRPDPLDRRDITWLYGWGRLKA